MEKIVLDTSFLLSCLEYKIDMVEELKRIINSKFKISVLTKTLDELNGKKNWRLAMDVIKKNGIEILESEGSESVDNTLLKFKDSIVATQDRALKEKLKNRKIPVITIRQKRYLMLV